MHVRQRLLYLGCAWPPGFQALYPAVNPAGHSFETQMIAALRPYFDIRSVGVLPRRPPCHPVSHSTPGIAHNLILLDKPPEVLHRFRSLARLKAEYRSWHLSGWEPTVVLVYNLSPIYNQFVLWLCNERQRPKLALLLLDSPSLGRQLPWLKRLRYRFKPMVVPDAEMISRFDACIGLSRATERYFRPREIPFLWMPGGCTPARATQEVNVPMSPPETGPIRFGYFGALAAHAGVEGLVRVFLRSDLSATLEICGYGRLGPQAAEWARHDRRLKYHGLLPTAADCLQFGRSCDVLINPRPDTHGNENNFPSKLFEYSLCGRAILTSRLSGVDDVLGPEGFYFDVTSFERSLEQSLRQVAALPRVELWRRGEQIRRRVTTEYSWTHQAERMAEFITRL